jgi:hypothetical protein
MDGTAPTGNFGGLAHAVRPGWPIDRRVNGRYYRDVNTNREERDFGLADLADEAWKPAAELGLLLIDPVFWGRGVRRGDERPVLVLPGLYGGDR